MRVVLIGADFEENLGLGMIAAVAEKAGHDVRVVPFNDAGTRKRIADQIVSTRPDVVGRSVVGCGATGAAPARGPWRIR